MGALRGLAPVERVAEDREAGCSEGEASPLIYYIFLDINIQFQGAAARYNPH